MALGNSKEAPENFLKSRNELSGSPEAAYMAQSAVMMREKILFDMLAAFKEDTI